MIAVGLRLRRSGASVAELMRGNLNGYELQRQLDARGQSLTTDEMAIVESFIENDVVGAEQWLAAAATQRIDDATLTVDATQPLPLSIGLIERDIAELTLHGEHITYVPRQLGHMRHLTALSIVNVPIDALPSSLGTLQALRTLVVAKTQLVALPNEVVRLAKLLYLRLEDNILFERLPATVVGLSMLKGLIISNSPRLRRVPETLAGLFHLEVLYLVNVGVTELPATLNMTDSLQRLVLESMPLQRLPSRHLGAWTRMRHLTLASLTRIHDVDALLASMPAVHEVRLRYMPRVEVLPVGWSDAATLLDVSFSGVKWLAPEVTRQTLRTPNPLEIIATNSRVRRLRSAVEEELLALQWERYVRGELSEFLAEFGRAKDSDDAYLIFTEANDVIDRLDDEFEAFNRIHGVAPDIDLETVVERIIDDVDERDTSVYFTQDSPEVARIEELLAIFVDGFGLPRTEWVAIHYPDLHQTYLLAMEELEQANIEVSFRKRVDNVITYREIIERYIRGAYELVGLLGRSANTEGFGRRQHMEADQRRRDRRIAAMVKPGPRAKKR